MKFSKKILAAFLAAIMAISMMPFTVFAADEPTVTWDAATENIQIGWKGGTEYAASYTKDAITVTPNTSQGAYTYINGTEFSLNQNMSTGGFIFENSVANFSKIQIVFNTEITSTNFNGIDTEWTLDSSKKILAWEGDSNSVELTAWWIESSGYNGISELNRIEFTYEEPAPDPVSYKAAAYDSATNTVTYTDATCDDYTVVAADTTTFEDGKWYVVNSNVTVNGRITVNGAANLILADGYTLTVTDGVAVTDPNSLTIFGQENGTGTLTATSTSYGAAGIGGNNDENGPITINGGTVNATSGSSGAGIGGGEMGNGGPVVINGGTVTAIGGEDDGAGIGSGGNGSSCNVTINGGTVNATGRKTYDNTAGIGNSGWSSNGGNITINGGTVNAACAAGSQGIGGSGCTISITGGTVDVNRGVTDASYGLFGSSFTMSGGEVYVNRFVYVSTTITGGTLIAEANPPFQSDVSIGTGLKVLAGANEESAVEVEPSFVDYHSNEYWNANPKWIKIYPAPALPTATVTDITDTEENTANLDKAYKFEANDDGEDYADYQADFIVTFSQDVTSDDLELWGKYGAYDWTAISSEAAGQTVTYEANTPYYLLKDIIKAPMTYGQIASAVGTFYCGIKAKPAAAGTTVGVELAIYDDTAATLEPIEIESTEDYTVPALPTATVTDITDTEENTANLDKAYKFVANDDGGVYADYQADFIVTFSQDVTSDDLELWGKYGAYDWTAISSEAAGQTVTYTANTPYYLLKDIIKAPMTYGQIASAVGTFYCGIKAKPSASGTTVGVELAIYDGNAETPEPVEIESTEDYTVPALPTATVTDITDTEENTANLDKAYKFVANDDGGAYADYQADFIVTFSQDVTSDDLELWGKYGAYDWTAISSEAAGQTVTYTANTPYYLLKDIIKAPMTYGQIASAVGTFYCGIKAKPSAAGTTVGVELAIYDDTAATPEPIEIESTEDYTVPEAEAHNGSSLTLNDKIDTTIYIDANAYDVNEDEGFIKVTYNHNPANEVKDVKTDIIPLSDLEVYAGDAQAYVGTYMFTFAQAPAQITETCKVELYANEEATSPVFTDEYSAKQYCDKVKNTVENYDGPLTSDSPLIKLYELCNALVDYAKAAQTQFNYGGDLTDPYNNEQVQTLAASDIVATDNVKAASAYGFAFDCTDDLNVIVYTQEEVAPTGVSMNATIYKDKLAAAAEKKDSTNFIRITGLGSGNINKVVTVSTANGDITVSPNAIAKAYVAADTMPSSMKDLARAIYLYGIATANYFGS